MSAGRSVADISVIVAVHWFGLHFGVTPSHFAVASEPDSHQES
jgi:hypothetical protein